jgi:membrane associated rhomboid family serine protease
LAAETAAASRRQDFAAGLDKSAKPPPSTLLALHAGTLAAPRVYTAVGDHVEWRGLAECESDERGVGFMVFPIGDDNSARRNIPIVTYLLIVINVLVFLLELNRGDNFIRTYAFIPREFSRNPAGEIQTVLTAMFMHGGWLHLFGNMLYLWIFGDNVEDNFGSVRFLIFYLLCGIAATFAQMWVMPQSNIPNLGASGAIAGVLGAYLVLFPHGRVRVLIGRGIAEVPALVAIGLWIVLQLVSGVGAIANSTQTAEIGGVAYMAHVGGFVAGVVLVFVFRDRAT